MSNTIKYIFTTFAMFFCLIDAASAVERMKPFVLAYKANGNEAQVVEEVKNKLVAAKFEIVGTYTPYAGANVIIITNDELKMAAAKSEYGGYGAAQRVTVTQVENELQVSYSNPTYLEAAYHMNAPEEMARVKASLASVLGSELEFGMKKGMTAKKLKKYHYMFGMEYFDEPSELAEYESYEVAISTLVAGLNKGLGGVKQVYRVDIPGKQQTVFGVSINPDGDEDCQSDEFIMSEIDFRPLRSTAHLPYEILVDGGEIFALYARFRIAINFPNLAMMGSNSFMNIMCAPGAIEDALTTAAGGKS
jgi:hypothetical protein